MQIAGKALKEVAVVEVGDRIRRDFYTTFVVWEQASEERKPEAYLRLTKAVRELYDFTVRGEVPQAASTRFSRSR
jgi:hypothetical protein